MAAQTSTFVVLMIENVAALGYISAKTHLLIDSRGTSAVPVCSSGKYTHNSEEFKQMKIKVSPGSEGHVRAFSHLKV